MSPEVPEDPWVAVKLVLPLLVVNVMLWYLIHAEETYKSS